MKLFKKSKFKKQTEEFLIEYHRLINDSRMSMRELERLVVEGSNKINWRRNKIMTRDKILEKVKVNIDRKNKKIEEERQESEYYFQCLSADVCPECGADMVEKTIKLSADQFYDLPISVLNSMPYRQFYDSKFDYTWEVKGHICNSCKTLFGPGCMTKIMPDWVIKEDIDEEKFDGGWYDFDEEVKFNIIPFNFSVVNIEDDISNIVKYRFMYCLVDWKGLVDKKGNTFKYTEDNKKLLYNYYSTIREFVFNKSNSEDREEE